MTNPLQRLVANRLAELELTYRAAAARSGGLVSHSTLHNITKGRVGRMEDDTLRGIALAIDVPVSQVRDAAGRAAGSETEFRLPKKANLLTDSQRRAVIRMVNAMLEGKDGGS